MTLSQVSMADHQAHRRRLAEAEGPRQQIRHFNCDPVNAIRRLVNQYAVRRAALVHDAITPAPPATRGRMSYAVA